MKKWTDLTWKQIQDLDRENTLFVMPVSSIEQHGLHLPVGTDYLILERMMADLLGRPALPFEVIVLPVLQYGLNEEHIRFPGTLALSQELIVQILRAQADSLVRHGFRNFILPSSHGGNTGMLESFIRSYRKDHDCRMSSFIYFKCEIYKAHPELFDNPLGLDVHAGEFETAIMLYLFPELVDTTIPRTQWTDCNVLASALPVGWLSHECSPIGVIGDGALATAEKGKAYFEIACDWQVEKLKDFMRGF